MTDDVATLPTHQVSAADRLRRFREDDEALAELAMKTHERAMAESENANASGHLDLKIRERRAAMWGYDSPIRFDMVALTEHREADGHERAMAVMKSFMDQLPPVRKALRRRLEELSPEDALERLGPPAPLPDSDDGNGAVGVLSDSSDKETNH